MSDPKIRPAPPDDAVAPQTLVEMYRTWSTGYLEQIRGTFVDAEAYNRKRREAIETVLDERKATS